MAETSAHNTSETTAQRPGPLLKQAREKMNLSVKEVAMQLNLQSEIIEALEQDHSERFPAATYARGYIRSYAKIVKLDGDELARLFDNESTEPPEIIPDIKTGGQASSQDKPVRAVTYLVTFILAILLLAWLQSNFVVDNRNDGEVAETAGDQVSDGYPEAPATDSHEPRPYGQPAPDEQISGLQINESALTEPINEDIINHMELSGIDGFVEPEVPAEDFADGAITGGAAMPLENSTDDRLVLNLTGDSWIEVYDAGDNRLYLGLGKAGEEISLTGTAPFSVLLGYSPAVEVTFNGNAFNAQSHSNAGIARFTLGQTEPDQ